MRDNSIAAAGVAHRATPRFLEVRVGLSSWALRQAQDKLRPQAKRRISASSRRPP